MIHLIMTFTLFLLCSIQNIFAAQAAQAVDKQEQEAKAVPFAVASIIIDENDDQFASYIAKGYELRTHAFTNNDNLSQSERFYYKLSRSGRTFINNPNDRQKLPEDIRKLLETVEFNARNDSEEPAAFKPKKNGCLKFTTEYELE